MPALLSMSTNIWVCGWSKFHVRAVLATNPWIPTNDSGYLKRTYLRPYSMDSSHFSTASSHRLLVECFQQVFLKLKHRTFIPTQYYNPLKVSKLKLCSLFRFTYFIVSAHQHEEFTTPSVFSGRQTVKPDWSESHELKSNQTRWLRWERGVWASLLELHAHLDRTPVVLLDQFSIHYALVGLHVLETPTGGFPENNH